MVPPPTERDLHRVATILAFAFAVNGDVPEWLGNEGLNSLILVHDETQRRKLAGAVADNLFVTELWDTDLQVLSEVPRKCSTYPKIQLGTRLHSTCLPHVELAGLAAGLVNLTESSV